MCGLCRRLGSQLPTVRVVAVRCNATSCMKQSRGPGPCPLMYACLTFSQGWLVGSDTNAAAACGVCEAELAAARAAREHSQSTCDAEMALAREGKERHAAVCRHAARSLRYPLQCRGCWMWPPSLCQCVIGDAELLAPPPDIELFGLFHHTEWGKTSNTGVALLGAVRDARMLLRGLPEHDAQLQAALADERTLVAVLWPGPRCDANEAPLEGANDECVDIGVLRQLARAGRRRADIVGPQCARIVLVVPDASWKKARRLANSLPVGTWRVGLTPSHLLALGDSVDVLEGDGASASSDDSDNACSSDDVGNAGASGGSAVRSMIAPLRGKWGVSKTGRVCTAQAAAAALLALGWDSSTCDLALERVRIRVALCLRLRGKKGALEAVAANKSMTR